MSMMVSFVLSFFPRDVLDEILNLIESVSEDFSSYFCSKMRIVLINLGLLKIVYQRKGLKRINQIQLTKQKKDSA